METNPVFGLLLIAIGAFSASSFYVPFTKVKGIAWEIYWMIGGLFSWIVVPVAVSMITVPNFISFLVQIPNDLLVWPFIFGILYGFGGLTFGLAMRYLGLSLGYAITLGVIATFGTLIPPIVNGQFIQMTTSTGGLITLAGIVSTLLGIGITGKAGILKDKNISDENKKESIVEFNFRKGVLVALFAGTMSACFAFGIAAGKPIADLTVEHGVNPLWRQNPVYVIMLLGTFTTNFAWCFYQAIRNKTLGDFLKAGSVPWLKNYLFAALGGSLWYFQFMLYGMGESKLGKFGFAGWSILMALTIVFSTFWGLYRNEWKNSGKLILRVLTIGLLVLIASTFIIGLGGLF